MTPPDDQYRLLGRLGFERDGASVVVPTWRARDVTREIDVVEEVARFRLEDVPFTLPAATRDVRDAHAATSSSAGASRTRWSGSGFAETYTPTPAARRRHALEAARADLGRAHRAAHAASAEPRRGGPAESRRGRVGDRAVRDRTRLPARWRPAGRARARGRDRRRRLLPRQGRRRGALRRAQGRASVRARARTRSSIPGRRRAPRPASSASSIRRCSTASGAAFELDLLELFAASREPVTYRDVIIVSRGAPGPRRSSWRRTSKPGDLSPPRAKRRAPSCARLRVFDVYRGEQVGDGPEVDRVLGRVPVARADAHRRGRGAAARADRRRARRAFRRRAPRVARRAQLSRARGSTNGRPGSAACPARRGGDP